MGSTGLYNSVVEDLGSGLKRLREARGLTQREVATRGLSDLTDPPDIESVSNYMSRVELGKERNPSLEFLERMAKGLDLTLSDFFLRIEGLRTDETSVTIVPTDRPVAGGSSSPHAPHLVSRPASDADFQRTVVTVLGTISAAVQRLAAASEAIAKTPRRQAATDRSHQTRSPKAHRSAG